jgi:hypothetical protein
MSKDCVVCQKENANYRCPCCRARYCSVTCCSTHKTSCSQLDQKEKDANGELDNESLKKEAVTESCPKREDSQRILTEAEKNKLKCSDALINQLKSKRLVDELLRIDTADDRQGELKKARNNPELESFMNLLLSIVEESNPS